MEEINFPSDIAFAIIDWLAIPFAFEDFVGTSFTIVVGFGIILSFKKTFIITILLINWTIVSIIHK